MYAFASAFTRPGDEVIIFEPYVLPSPLSPQAPSAELAIILSYSQLLRSIRTPNHFQRRNPRFRPDSCSRQRFHFERSRKRLEDRFQRVTKRHHSQDETNLDQHSSQPRRESVR